MISREYNPQAHLPREQLSEEVLSYVDNLKVQITQICNQYNLQTKADLDALADRTDIDLTTIKKLRQLGEKLKSAVEKNEIEPMSAEEIIMHAKEVLGAFQVLSEMMKLIETPVDMSNTSMDHIHDSFDSAYKIIEELADSNEYDLAESCQVKFAHLNIDSNDSQSEQGWQRAAIACARARLRKKPGEPVDPLLVDALQKYVPPLEFFKTEIALKIIDYYLENGDTKNAKRATKAIHNTRVKKLEQARIDGGWDEVVRLAVSSLRKNPASLQDALYLVHAYAKLGKWDEAKQAIQDFDWEDDDSEAKKYLVEEYVGRGMIDDALLMFNREEESDADAVTIVLAYLVQKQDYHRAELFFKSHGKCWDVRTQIEFYRVVAFACAEQGLEIPAWISNLFEQYKADMQWELSASSDPIPWHEAAAVLVGIPTGIAIRKFQRVRRLFQTNAMKQRLLVLVGPFKNNPDVLSGIGLLSKGLVADLLVKGDKSTARELMSAIATVLNSSQLLTEHLLAKAES